MELIEDENLVTALHDYHSWIKYIEIVQSNMRGIVVNQYLPFMSNYSEYFGLIKEKIFIIILIQRLCFTVFRQRIKFLTTQVIWVHTVFMPERFIKL